MILFLIGIIRFKIQWDEIIYKDAEGKHNKSLDSEGDLLRMITNPKFKNKNLLNVIFNKIFLNKRP